MPVKDITALGTLWVPDQPWRKVTAKAVNTSNAATDLLNGELVVPDGAMGVSNILRLSARGDWLNNTGGAVVHPQFQVVFGGTTLIDTNRSGTTAAGATRGGWSIVVDIINLGAANSQLTSFSMMLATPVGTTAFPGAPVTTGEGYLIGISQAASATNTGLLMCEAVNPSTAVDTTRAQLLALNVINGSALSTYETKLIAAYAEIL